MLRACAIVWLLLYVLAAAALAAEPKLPALTAPLVDAAHILVPEDAAQISARLRAYEISTGHQIAVAIVPSLEGYEIRDYGIRLFRAWALGDAKRNDGVLLLVAPNERKVSIEVGYGLEGDLTDAASRLIIENAIKPHFKNGDFTGGISAGISDIAKIIGGQGEALTQKPQAEPLRFIDFLPLIILFIIVLIMISNASRGRRVIFVPFPGGGGYRGGYGGGGWSGGGGGGWSGGGGSSGGGGASGSW